MRENCQRKTKREEKEKESNVRKVIHKYGPKTFFPFKILKNIFTHFRVFSIFQDFSNDLEVVFDLFIDLNIGSLFYPFLLIDHSFSINRTKHSLNFQLCYSKNKLRSFFKRKQNFFILFLEQKIEKGFIESFHFPI